MITITVFYPATPPAQTDVIVFSARADEDDNVSIDLRDAVSIVNQEIGNMDGVLGVDVSDDESGDLSVFYDPEAAPWEEWYQNALHGIWVYYNAVFGRAFDFNYETKATTEL